MAWTGAATVEQINDRVVRISGTLSLAGAASGTIGFPGETVPADVELPELPNWTPRLDASLADLIEARMTITTDVTAGVPISVTKGGTDQTDFKLTFHNDTAATASGELEIWIEIH
jgi:hypothetical protein